MQTPSSRRTAEYDRQRELVLLGLNDGTALAAFFTELRRHLAAVPAVEPRPDVGQCLRGGPLGDDAGLVDTQPLPLSDGFTPLARSESGTATRRPKMALVGVIAVLAVGGGLALWAASSRADGPNSSVAAEDDEPRIGHHSEETALGTIPLGLAGSVTVDVQDGQPLLAYPNPSSGWMVTSKRDDCTELTLSRGNDEIITVSLVSENSGLWVEIFNQQDDEVTRVFFAEHVSSGSEVMDDPSPDPADSPSPATSTEPRSGVPATGVAPGGGDPISSTNTTQATTTSSSSPSSTTTTLPPTTTTSQPGDDDDGGDDDNDG